MTGISEILILILLIVCILILPRLLKGVPANRPARSSQKLRRLGPRARLGIVASLLYPVLLFLYLKPWQSGAYLTVLSFGILPVLIAWSIAWVIAGRKK